MVFFLDQLLSDVDEDNKYVVKKTRTAYRIFDYNGKTIFFEKEAGTRNYTLSVATLEKMYIKGTTE